MIAESGILDQVTQQFLSSLSRNTHLIERSATQIFYYLAVIQLSLTAIWMSVAGESLQRFLTRMLQLGFNFGFYFGLIQFGGQWMPQLINSFISIGQQAGVASVDPSSIVDQGLSISGNILSAFNGWGLLTHPFVSVLGAIVCISILVIYAMIAAELACILVKAYMLLCVGSLFFAFGASDFTQEMAKRYFKALIGIGLNLMTLYLLLGVGQSIGMEWASMTSAAAKNHELMPMLVILAAVIVYFLILKNVPSFIAGLSGVGGFRNYGEAAVGMAMNMGANTAGALLRAKSAAASGIKSGAQGALAATKIIQSGISNSMGNAASQAGQAAYHTVKDTVLRQNSKLTAGQKFNKHMTNTVRPRGK